MGLRNSFVAGSRLVADATVLLAAVVVLAVTRGEASTVADVLGLAVSAAGAQAAAGSLLGLYTGRWRHGSFEEVSALAAATVVATVAAAAADLFVWRAMPLRDIALTGALALVLMAGGRSVERFLTERRLRPSPDGAQRVVVVGAGDAGAQVVSAMLRTPTSPYLPVGLLDDDPAKSSLRIMGVPVLGGHQDLRSVVRRTRADAVVVAIPSAGPGLIRAVAELADAEGTPVNVLPPVAELFGVEPRINDIRPLADADLLGRHEVDIDLAAVAGYLQGRRVLVTGAGGSIGSELCRQVARFDPEALVMLDRDESGLHGVQLSLDGRALLDDHNLVVADIRDTARIEEVFCTYRPEVVFHAAALKHLPLLEMHPSEAAKTNVLATQSLLETALRHGVLRFINISTDKAADPISVLGYSKRITERLTAFASQATDAAFLSVRFGNVLGSRGSVLTAFRHQIDTGGPLTVTDPAVTRYFMTVEEAVRLVIQAGAIGGPGEALVLDMGEPVRIAAVAERLRDAAERPVDIVFTGLRPGEKLHETLRGRDEADWRPRHPLVSHVVVPPLHPKLLALIDTAAPPDAVTATLRWLAEAPPLVTVPGDDDGDRGAGAAEAAQFPPPRAEGRRRTSGRLTVHGGRT